jgi:hypothetical protein
MRERKALICSSNGRHRSETGTGPPRTGCDRNRGKNGRSRSEYCRVTTARVAGGGGAATSSRSVADRRSERLRRPWCAKERVRAHRESCKPHRAGSAGRLQWGARSQGAARSHSTRTPAGNKRDLRRNRRRDLTESTNVMSASMRRSRSSDPEQPGPTVRC